MYGVEVIRRVGPRGSIDTLLAAVGVGVVEMVVDVILAAERCGLDDVCAVGAPDTVHAAIVMSAAPITATGPRMGFTTVSLDAP